MNFSTALLKMCLEAKAVPQEGSAQHVLHLLHLPSESQPGVLKGNRFSKTSESQRAEQGETCMNAVSASYHGLGDVSP